MQIFPKSYFVKKHTKNEFYKCFTDLQVFLPCEQKQRLFFFRPKDPQKVNLYNYSGNFEPNHTYNFRAQLNLDHTTENLRSTHSIQSKFYNTRKNETTLQKLRHKIPQV